MPVAKGPHFNERDIYVDYPFEDVCFRWCYKSQMICRKFYGEMESTEAIPHDNGLWNEALLSGNEITEYDYNSK